LHEDAVHARGEELSGYAERENVLGQCLLYYVTSMLDELNLGMGTGEIMREGRGKPKYSEKKTIRMSPFPPQIPHGLP
jgi:hypothetical protein